MFATETVFVQGERVEALVTNDEVTELLECPFCAGIDVRARHDWGFACGGCNERFDIPG